MLFALGRDSWFKRMDELHIKPFLIHNYENVKLNRDELRKLKMNSMQNDDTKERLKELK